MHELIIFVKKDPKPKKVKYLVKQINLKRHVTTSASNLCNATTRTPLSLSFNNRLPGEVYLSVKLNWKNKLEDLFFVRQYDKKNVLDDIFLALAIDH